MVVSLVQIKLSLASFDPWEDIYLQTDRVNHSDTNKWQIDSQPGESDLINKHDAGEWMMSKV